VDGLLSGPLPVPGSGQVRLIAAPDSFKGSLSAVAAAGAMERGILSVLPSAEVIRIPVADGGEGTVAALVASTGGKFAVTEVSGPLGRPVNAVFGILGGGTTSVVEVSAAVGLPLVPTEERDPEKTTSFGVGELIRAALDSGCRKLIVGLGGSSTNDGGIGMAAALGARFLDSRGRAIEPMVGNLERIASLDLSGLDPRLAEADISGACDVHSPLLGSDGASLVFAPQKGATPEQAVKLDVLLGRLAELIRQATGRDVANLEGAGAAGGLGAGVAGFLGGRLVSGSDLVLELSRLEEHLAAGAELVLTGEGEINRQTVLGKAPGAVARLARRYGLPVIAVVGGRASGYAAALAQGIDAVYTIVPRPMSLVEAMRDAGSLLEEGVAELMRLWLLARRGRKPGKNGVL